MPQPTRTRPQANHRVTTTRPASTDILDSGVPIGDIPEDPVHALIYGKNGTGKTTLACQFEKPLALVSVEPSGLAGGARSVKKIPGIIHFRFTESAKVKELGDALKGKGSDNPYKTVVIDSGSSLDEIVLAEVCNWDQTAEMNKWGKVSMDEYGERSERMRKILRPYLDLPVNVILIANEKDHNFQEGTRKSSLVRSLHTESFFAAAMGGGTARWCMDGCDFVCQLYIDKEIKVQIRGVGKKGTPQYQEKTEEVETGRWVRRLRTAYHPNYASRVRSEDADTVPEYIEAQTPAEMYEKFMRVVRGESQ